VARRKHGPVVGSIVEGSTVYQIEGQPEAILQAGDVFFEPEGERIARFDARDDGVTFLAYFLLATEQDAQLTFPRPVVTSAQLLAATRHKLCRTATR